MLPTNRPSLERVKKAAEEALAEALAVGRAALAVGRAAEEALAAVGRAAVELNRQPE